ncbi:hypothetical protein ACIQI7_32410 [Kitasatospora sp. NPDC092039]|uniref:hypothetical protein n=1 Tax=Kitasatospora sp. NPDC092039 TaxID=3364086 RepID=UPI00381B02E5
MTEQTTRARLLSNALDTADNVAIAAAAAAAGLTTYRTLAARPTETRFILAAAAAGIAACLADQATTQLRRPLRNRLGVPAYGYAPTPAAPAPAPSREQLAEEVASDAAHRAATHAHGLDRSGGSLTEAANWVGSTDGTATCELPGGAHLLCVPSPADPYGHSTRTYLLVRDGEQIRVSSISELVALLDNPTPTRRSPPTTRTRPTTRGPPSAATSPSPSCAPPNRSTARTTSTRRPRPTPPACCRAVAPTAARSTSHHA